MSLAIFVPFAPTLHIRRAFPDADRALLPSNRSHTKARTPAAGALPPGTEPLSPRTEPPAPNSRPQLPPPSRGFSPRCGERRTIRARPRGSPRRSRRHVRHRPAGPTAPGVGLARASPILPSPPSPPASLPHPPAPVPAAAGHRRCPSAAAPVILGPLRRGGAGEPALTDGRFLQWAAIPAAPRPMVGKLRAKRKQCNAGGVGGERDGRGGEEDGWGETDRDGWEQSGGKGRAGRDSCVGEGRGAARGGWREG